VKWRARRRTSGAPTLGQGVGLAGRGRRAEGFPGVAHGPSGTSSKQEQGAATTLPLIRREGGQQGVGATSWGRIPAVEAQTGSSGKASSIADAPGRAVGGNERWGQRGKRRQSSSFSCAALRFECCSSGVAAEKPRCWSEAGGTPTPAADH